MTASSANAMSLLPHPVPDRAGTRLLLFGMRRMAAGGLADAHAASAFFGGFGLGYRRPLIFTRAMMAEISRVAATRLMMGPCCCPSMSDDERTLLAGISGAEADASGAHGTLRGLLHVRCCWGVVSGAQAVHGSFADLGMPISAGGDCV